MPFVVTECDPREIPFFHHDRAFRCHDPSQIPATSVDPRLSRLLAARGSAKRSGPARLSNETGPLTPPPFHSGALAHANRRTLRSALHRRGQSRHAGPTSAQRLPAWRGRGAASELSTGMPCGDVNARRDGKPYSEDGDQADPAMRPDMEWTAKKFRAAPVDNTDQNHLGDDDDARDAQRGRHPHQVTPSLKQCMKRALPRAFECRTAGVDSGALHL